MSRDIEPTEIPNAMSLLSQTIGSLRHDANVALLGEIIKTFAANDVSLHDFILAISNVIANQYGNDVARLVNHHLEIAAAEADELQSARSE